MPYLYHRNVDGSIQQWRIIVDGDKYKMEFGRVNGKLVETKWTLALSKNFGKKNETSGEEQALKEANAMYQLKIKSDGYVENIEDVDKKRFQEPMLAEDSKKRNRLDSLSFEEGIYCQPKLDGVRCNINNEYALSRRGNPFYTIGHIIESLKEVTSKYPNITWDGELYCDKLNNDFNTIISLVRKQKPTEEDLKACKESIEYHVYDMFDGTDKLFSERNKIINEILKDIPFVKIVPTYKVDSKDDLDELYERFIMDGYEGQIIRKNAPYEHKRTTNLLKRKTFDDDEFEIIDICAGVGNKSNMAGYAIMKDNKSNQTFKSNVKGSWNFCKDLLINKDKYIGQMATIQFFRLTPESVDKDGNKIGRLPRFPYIIAIRNYE